MFDGVMVLRDAYMLMDKYDECKACFERAKEGFDRLLREKSAKAVDAVCSVASHISSDDEVTAEFRRIWEMAKVSLPYEAVT